MSQKIVGFLLKSEPTATLVDRPIGSGTITHTDGNYATALGSTQQLPMPTSRAGSFSQSEDLIQELESSDFVVIGTPMHNFTVPSALKAWIDHIVRVRRTFNVTTEGKVGTLRDRPVFIAVSSGGRYSGERARQPDFLTPYLKAILATIGLHDLTFFSIEGTALDPASVAAARARTDQALQEYFGRRPNLTSNSPLCLEPSGNPRKTVESALYQSANRPTLEVGRFPNRRRRD
jgi:FMN-dependent NADH-azoreductase